MVDDEKLAEKVEKLDKETAERTERLAQNGMRLHPDQVTQVMLVILMNAASQETQLEFLEVLSEMLTEAEASVAKKKLTAGLGHEHLTFADLKEQG